MNLASYVKNKFSDDAYFDFETFTEDVKIATNALNDILDEGVPFHPLEEQKEMASNYRQIGLGVMGYGDMLIMLGIKYGSSDALKVTERVASALLNSALQKSAMLAKEQGAYPKYNKEAVLKSEFLKANATKETIELIEEYGLRNSQVLTSAPTGSLSTMWGITGGIEPIYQLSYTRKTETLNNGQESFYSIFTSIAREYMELNNIRKESDLPDFFVTAMTLNWKDRINTQAVWQQYIDASISSTVNLPKDITVEEIKELYIYAWQMGLKGVTIFRDGCKRAGVLGNHTQSNKSLDSMTIEDLQDLIYQKAQNAVAENPNLCPMCGGNLIYSGGCSECEVCHYSPCSL